MGMQDIIKVDPLFEGLNSTSTLFYW